MGLLISFGTPRLLAAVLAALLSLSILVPGEAAADVVICNNGERFVGRILEETAESVLFESELVGRIKLRKEQIQEVQRSPDPAAADRTGPGADPNSITADWLQLTSGEWLKGDLKYIRGRGVQFESEKLEDLSLKLRDVRQFQAGKPMMATFDSRDEVEGTLQITNGTVSITGEESVVRPVEDLTGVTPVGEKELDYWSFRGSVGLNLQSGNTRQLTLSSSARVVRRTPATQLLLEQLGNYSETDGEQSANNHRVNTTYDVRLNRDWFVRPVQAEWYRDQLANLSARLTAGIGVGYYIFDREELEWNVAAGPSFQYTRFQTVEPGEASSEKTPAGVLQTSFKMDLTRRLDFSQTFAATLTSREAGMYSHHALSTLAFEIKRHLDLNVSFVWDYLDLTQTSSSGEEPQNDDLRLIVGVGIRF